MPVRRQGGDAPTERGVAAGIAYGERAVARRETRGKRGRREDEPRKQAGKEKAPHRLCPQYRRRTFPIVQRKVKKS